MGRKALREVLPQWKEKYKPDVTVVNVENLAHGKGVTPATLADIDQLDIDCFTSGNHIFDKKDYVKECFEKYPKLIRPANLQGVFEGFGYYRFSKSGQQYLIMNFHGTVFLEKEFGGSLVNPFVAADALLKQESQKGDIILVDFHAEATSEKVALGYYLDGRVSALVGTHTHVPTADARTLPNGTAYLSDVGMTGSLNGVLGVKKENVIDKFLNPENRFKNEPEEEGVMQINGVLVEISAEGKATAITKLFQEISN